MGVEPLTDNFAEAEPIAVNPDEVSEDAIALAFTAQYRDTMRYCHHAGKWYEWDSTRWRKDEEKRAFHFARQLARNMAQGKKSTCKANVAAGAERFCQADPAHAVTAAIWDSDPMLLGTPAGIVDLRTGRLRRPDPSAYITRLTGVSPSSDEPVRWLEFLRQTTGDDQEMIDFLQRMCGYCLTGLTTEHALFFIYGPGGNGKSVFLNVLTHLLGEYAATAAMETFQASKHQGHPADLAMLQGARGVFASETDAGATWAEARIKQMTGGDPISARFMRQDFFTYTPQFKLLIVGNHAPAIRAVDDAMRRRINIIPFTRKPDRVDPMLGEKLKEEAPGILNWMIRGCLAWQEEGLGRPGAIREATDEYFADQDTLGQWMAEECDLDPAYMDTSQALFSSFAAFMKRMGENPGSNKAFSLDMQRRGFQRKRSGQTLFVGIRVRANGQEYGHD